MKKMFKRILVVLFFILSVIAIAIMFLPMIIIWIVTGKNYIEKFTNASFDFAEKIYPIF